MTKRIAVAGKGGTGKTTFIVTLIEVLLKNNKIPILAVDADPNSNLGELLDINYETTIADIREELRKPENIPKGFSKPDYINLQIQQALVESTNIDLIVMGRPEGRECYCYVNELLRNFLSRLSKDYKYVIIDNEAGMEHLSRRTTDNIDFLFILSEPTFVSVKSAIKIKNLTKQISLKIDKICLVLNKVKEKLSNELTEEIKKNNFNFVYTLDYEEKILEKSEQDIILRKIIQDTLFFKKIQNICEELKI